jgi:EAL domain-containing protein (putative c-di-GMP-specific phosphodiesterase class I)
VALDDFGTGYSTLVNVKSFPLDCIKIDKSFIDGLGTERESTVIVSSITHLARGLGLNVVAEGVESDAQCQALRVVGCNQLQGYLFGEAEELEAATARYSAECDMRTVAREMTQWASG